MRLAPSIKRLFGWSPVRYASRVLVAQIGQSLRLQTVSLVSQALGILVVVFYFYRTLSHELVIGWGSRSCALGCRALSAAFSQ